MLYINKVLRSLSVVLLFLFMCSSAYAQETIVGAVTSADDGAPLPGVNITVQGTDIGTTTDAEGNYSIDVPEGNDVLVFSFVGFQTQEIEIDGRSEIDVELQAEVISGEELVVVGYGSQRESDLTGSINRITSDEISKQPSLTAMESLQGKLSGANIINSNEPGGSPSVILRGLGTALGGKDPLYVVDGVPVDDINNISPSDIESVDVLKDASSASIYGLRAANGVIIISTKEGEEGAPQIEVDSYAGYNSVLNQVDMADAQQYITYFNEENAALDEYQLNSDQQYNTNWFDELIGMGHTIDNKVSVSGGLENLNYFLSYSARQEKGLLDDQKFWRQSIRNNNQYRLFDDILTIDQNLSVSFSKENPQPRGAFNTAYRQSPLVPTFYENGRFGQPFVNETTGEVTYQGEAGESIGQLNSHGNPLTSIAFNNQTNNTITLQGSASADLNLTDYLTVTSRFGATRYYEDQESFNPNKQSWIAGDPTRTESEFETEKADSPESTSWANNSLAVSNTETFRWNWDNFVTFEEDFDVHDVEVTLGMSSEKFGVGTTFSGNAYDVPNAEQYWNMDLASDSYEKEVNHTNFTPSTLLSYFGRVQYNYDERYYVTGTLRRDGSSKFSNNEEYWELFPSVGLGWTLTNEDFFSDNESIDFLKLRASWGRLGNQNVPFNSTNILSSTGSASQNYVFGSDQTLRFGASAGSPAQDISWETVSEWNVGFDLETFDNRLSTTVDAYQKTTENVILEVTPLPNSPFTEDFFDHGGEVVNQGLELTLDWNDEISSDFNYNVGLSFSYNMNEVTDVEPGYEGLTGGSLNNGEITKRLEEGQPLGAWWLYEVEGVWQSQDEIDNNPSIGGALPGHLRYKDLNDDGNIDERDRRYYGSYVPNYNLGIKMGANYKRFDFSLDAFGVAGNKVYNGLNNTRLGGENTTEEMFQNRWTEEGSTNSHPGANRDELPSDYYLENGSYLRINNLTLGYTFDDIAPHVNNVRVYMSAQNPLLVTGYSGFTPELIGNNNGDPYGTAGMEFSAYPNTRSLLFGVNIDLQ